LYRQLIFWIKQAEEIYGKVVIAVDDMDKKETPIVHQILESSLELFRQSKKRAFLMTGRGFTDLQDGTLRALGIFSESIELATMSDVELRKIALNYLNSGRITASTKVLPFTEKALAQIVDSAQGIPRQLTFICEKMLRKAAMKGYEQIDVLDKDVIESLRQDLLLYALDPKQEISEDISNGKINQLNVVNYPRILSELIKLDNMNFIARSKKESVFSLVPSKFDLPTSD
jgi:hypothetical protein